jgi:hypothetical protein
MSHVTVLNFMSSSAAPLGPRTLQLRLHGVAVTTSSPAPRVLSACAPRP